MASPLRTIRDIEREIVNHANRKWWKLLFHAKYDKEKVQGWKLALQKTLGIFNVRCTAQVTPPMVPEGSHSPGSIELERYVPFD